MIEANLFTNIIEKVGRDSLGKISVQSKLATGKHILPAKSIECFDKITSELAKMNEILEKNGSKKIAFLFQKYLIAGITWSMGGEESCQRRQVIAKMTTVYFHMCLLNL